MVGHFSQQQKKVSVGGREEIPYDGDAGDWPEDEDDYFQRSADLFDRSDIFNGKSPVCMIL